MWDDTIREILNENVSQDALNARMAEHAEIKKDPSLKRGYYIVMGFGTWYLHHDGNVKAGVIAEGNSKDAFWNTEEEAEEFFAEFKKTTRNLAQEY